MAKSVTFKMQSCKSQHGICVTKILIKKKKKNNYNYYNNNNNKRKRKHLETPVLSFSVLLMEKQNQAEIVDARRPCFFELFSSNLSAHRLKIPVKFIKHLEGRTSGSVSLIGPSGNVWPVKLIQQNDQLILDRGWPTFVQDHLIECGDLLVFRYDGHLCFTVLVFDPSACEKDSAFHSKCSEDLSRFCASVGHKREREEKDEEASSSDYKFDSMPKKAKGRCFDFLSDHVGTKQKVGLAINDNGGCQHNDENMNKRCQDAGFHYEASQCRSLPECPVTPSELKSCSEKPGKKDN